jgi:hypothetical protein
MLMLMLMLMLLDTEVGEGDEVGSATGVRVGVPGGRGRVPLKMSALDDLFDALIVLPLIMLLEVGAVVGALGRADDDVVFLLPSTPCRLRKACLVPLPVLPAAWPHVERAIISTGIQR